MAMLRATSICIGNACTKFLLFSLVLFPSLRQLGGSPSTCQRLRTLKIWSNIQGRSIDARKKEPDTEALEEWSQLVAPAVDPELNPPRSLASEYPISPVALY